MTVFRRWHLFLIVVLAAVAGAETFYLLRPSQEPIRKEELPLRERNSVYRFTNPLLLCNNYESRSFQELQSLENTVRNLIVRAAKTPVIDGVSVYFRDLETGRWLAINDQEKYTPASLLKVATMIAYFKLAEGDPAVLRRRFSYDGTFDANKLEYIKAAAIQAGQTYTVEELLRAMIVSSDNNAAVILRKNLDAETLREIYNDLGIALPQDDEDFDFMSVKNYSYFFRILYNATYLNKDFSERALELLSEIGFKDGLVAGVPADTVVVHKFGERGTYLKGDIIQPKEFHDCGIVYRPGAPYFLCVMTKGRDFDPMINLIKKISKLVYDEVQRL